MVKYVVDTSAFVMGEKYYPHEQIEAFWNKIHSFNKEGKLIIIKKVKEELKKGYDFLSNGFFENKVISNEEIDEIVSLFPKIVNGLPIGNRVGFESWLKYADPYVVAYALFLKEKGEEVILLHGEVENGSKIRIPYVCNILGIHHGPIHTIIREEKLKFELVS